MLAARRDYAELVRRARVRIDEIDVEDVQRGRSTLGYDAISPSTVGSSPTP